jgi:hypothetical protein
MALDPPLNVAANDLAAIPVSGLSMAAADVAVGVPTSGGYSRQKWRRSRLSTTLQPIASSRLGCS